MGIGYQREGGWARAWCMSCRLLPKALWCSSYALSWQTRANRSHTHTCTHNAPTAKSTYSPFLFLFVPYLFLKVPRGKDVFY